MKFFNVFNNFFNKYLVVIVLVVAALSLFWPQSFLWASSYTTLFL